MGRPAETRLVPSGSAPRRQRPRRGSGADRLVAAIGAPRLPAAAPEDILAPLLVPGSSGGVVTLTAVQEEVRAAMVASASRFQLLAAPPGCGKTVVMMAIIRDYIARGFWVVCLVPLSRVCGDIRRKLVVAGVPESIAAATVITIQKFTHRGYDVPDAAFTASRRLIVIDEALAASSETLDAVYRKICGDVSAVRFALFGDPFQTPAVGTPAAHSVLLHPATLQIFAFSSSRSQRQSHPMITTILASLRSVKSVPVVAHRALSLWHYAGSTRPVDTWIVASHRLVDYYNRLWQERSGSATLTAETVQLRPPVASQDIHPVRLCVDDGEDERVLKPNVMATTNFKVTDGGGEEWQVTNRDVGRVLGWVTAGYEGTETVATTCGDATLAVTVQFCTDDGAATGPPVVISPILVDDGRCRRLPLQGLGAVTIKVLQGMSLPKTQTYGVDDTGAVDQRSFHTVAVSRVEEKDACVDLVAGAGQYGLVRMKYSAGCGVLADVPRTAAETELRRQIADLYEEPDGFCDHPRA